MFQNVCISEQEKEKRNIGAVSQLAALVEKRGQRPCLLWHHKPRGSQYIYQDSKSFANY